MAPRAPKKPTAKVKKTKTIVKKAAVKEPRAKDAAEPSPTNSVAAPKATVVQSVKPVLTDAPIKKPELIDRVVEKTGLKKKDVKPIVEGMLSVMADALSKGEEITAPPLGKVMIKWVKDLPNAKVLTVKIRIPNEKAGKD